MRAEASTKPGSLSLAVQYPAITNAATVCVFGGGRNLRTGIHRERGNPMARRLRILSVDAKDVLERRNASLVAQGYRVSSAYNASKVRRAAEKQRFDLVIIGCSLSSFEKTDVLQCVKAKHPDIPVVMIHGSERSYTSGIRADHYVEATEEPAAVFAVIERLSRTA